MRNEIINRKLKTKGDVDTWLWDMINANMAYHYDDDPKDVYHIRNGKLDDRVFSDEEAQALREKMNDCKDICGSWNNFWEMVPVPNDE